MPTHKKAHDKDKYYHLAKDQGYRARSAFKLIQINKRFDFLSKAKVLIDLCAAPGGWCQVAAKAMPQGSLILGVDLLQIPAIRNVKTLVHDITTSECRKAVKEELQGWKADVVLCDGAPNIGSAYSKDAYVQNELVVAALKTACDHLAKGGTFCTKVYRSTDYAALMWAFQHLFEDIQTVKPNSSRAQSSEIFVVCLRFTAPNKIDPKLFDPNHLFKEVVDPGLKKVDIFHKKYEQSNKRSRGGYDASLGLLLESKTTVTDFLSAEDPIQMLTDQNKIIFVEGNELSDKCFTHPRTSDEMKTCLSDLRVLGKIDFKKMLKWRQLMLDSFVNPKKDAAEEVEDQKKNLERREKDREIMTDEKVSAELRTLRQVARDAEHKVDKKQRKEARKLRERQNLGMTNNAFQVQGDLELFKYGVMCDDVFYVICT
jgi:AdoMet-dependent rRNA methyltransferase SPB1